MLSGLVGDVLVGVVDGVAGLNVQGDVLLVHEDQMLLASETPSVSGVTLALAVWFSKVFR